MREINEQSQKRGPAAAVRNNAPRRARPPGHVTAEQVPNVQTTLSNHLKSELDAPSSPTRPRIVAKLLQHYEYLQSPRRTSQCPPPSSPGKPSGVKGGPSPARNKAGKSRRPQSAPQPHPHPVHPLAQQSHSASSSSLLHSPTRSPTRVRDTRASQGKPKEGQSALMRQWANVGVRESKEKKLQQELEVLSALADEKMIRSDDALLGGL